MDRPLFSSSLSLTFSFELISALLKLVRRSFIEGGGDIGNTTFVNNRPVIGDEQY